TWTVVRDYPHEKGYRDFVNISPADRIKTSSGIFYDLFEVLKYPNTLLLFIIPGGIVGCVLTFSGLWGVPFLSSVHGISQIEAATLTSILLVAWAVGGPFFGFLSDRLKNRKTLYLTGCGISVAGWAIVILVQNISLPLLISVLLVTGFSSGCMIISFAFVKESVPVHLAGTVSGVVNMGVMSGPMLLQPAVGWVLDRMWTGEMELGVRVYDFPAYRSGFGLMLGWIAMSFLLLLFTRETGCRQTT
ncbi:MAG: MFS transporter, partial [Desulforhopalus sp.]